MDFDFYLSEMSISDATGGGLTLQRILGADIAAIPLFAHVHPYGHLESDARQDSPAESVRSRCLDLPPLWLTLPAARRMFGSRPAYWLAQRSVLRRWHAHKTAAALAARLPDGSRPLRGLVCPQHATSLYVLESLRRLRNLEYVTWIMDDHLVRWRDGGWVYPPNMEALFARHLQQARAVFVISPVMADLYRARFGVESRVLFGPADAPALPESAPPSLAGKNLRLAYFGAVDAWQLDALALVAANLPAAGASLDIYAGLAELPVELRQPTVRLMGRIPAAQVMATMGQYHAVVLPVSFLAQQRNMSELNIATKMSECLASGTVTLAVGPPYAAMLRYLQQHAAALCVTEPTDGAMQEALVKLCDINQRRALADTARSLATQQLSTAAMRAVWVEGLARLGLR
jgi:hypothetical protein